jgi:diadenosine tetraphosphate (Ap4A) HIT family hydrolase
MSHEDCAFCRKDEMKNKFPANNGEPIDCERWIYEDQNCFAVLSPEQYTVGYTLLISSKHKVDITDSTISEDDFSGFFHGIRKVANLLKEFVQNDNNEKPEKIYVCILCDGIEHLHAHLIPRYQFTKADEIIYKHEFLNRDGAENVEKQIHDHHLGGFWYIAERERNFKGSDYGRKDDHNKAIFLAQLAKKIRAEQSKNFNEQ